MTLSPDQALELRTYVKDCSETCFPKSTVCCGNCEVVGGAKEKLGRCLSLGEFWILRTGMKVKKLVGLLAGVRSPEWDAKNTLSCFHTQSGWVKAGNLERILPLSRHTKCKRPLVDNEEDRSRVTNTDGVFLDMDMDMDMIKCQRCGRYLWLEQFPPRGACTLFGRFIGDFGAMKMCIYI